MPITWVVGDFETASTCNLKKAGAARYAEDITTEILCFAYTHMGEEPKLWKPGDPIDDLEALAANSDVIFVAHNAFFEKMIWRRIMVGQYGFSDIPNSRWHDTMASCAMKLIPQDLDTAARVLRLPQLKDKDGSKLTISLSKPKKDGSYDRSPGTLARVYSYGLQDIRTEVELHARVGWLPPGERGVWLLDQRINERGVRLDLPYVAASRDVVEKASVPLVAEFQALTGLNSVGQNAKLMGWCVERGVTLPNMQKETLARLLGGEDNPEEYDDDGSDDEPIELPGDVRRALQIRQLIGSASVKKLARMETCVCADGRARGLLQYHGAGPGRWAGRLLQPQNFPRGTLEDYIEPQTVVDAILTRDPEWIETLIGPAVETVVSGLRHALIPNDDRVFMAGDFTQIEMRVLLALAGQTDKVEMLARGERHPYVDMAELIYKRPISKKKDLAEYTVGKNTVLGLGFQMGAKKYRIKYAPKETLEWAQDKVDIYRNEWAPNVKHVWWDLQEAAVRTVWDRVPHEEYGVRYELVDGWMTARLPSGRKLWYPLPEKVKRAMPWDATDVRAAWTYRAMKMGQWKEINAYGGLLTENVVQALARDLMVAAMFKCEQNNLPVVLTVHDEIVCEPLAKDADPLALEQIMCDIPAWAKAMGIPVGTEVWVGDRYKK